MKVICSRTFANGIVYGLQTKDGYPIEVTDTFLPYYTKNAVGRKQNNLVNYNIGSRSDRWMIGVSCMSGCPVGCKFCATGQLKRCRNLSATEIVDQVKFIVENNRDYDPTKVKEFKINYTRMGEPFLNIDAVREAIAHIDTMIPNTHHYISTIGIEGSDFSWIKDNITLQISLHSLNKSKRDWLIPFKRKLSLEDLGRVKTKSNLKTTLNMTLVDENDFDVTQLVSLFDKKDFFVKLSPINPNTVSNNYNMGTGVIKSVNLS